jgi:similar to spore coat protein
LETGGKIKMNPTYALHETLEAHEIAAFKTVCMTKSKTMQALVSDPELMQILQEDVKLSTRQLQELSAQLSKAMV